MKPLTDQELPTLYAKFSAPIFRAAKTSSQRVAAQRLAQMLWLALLTGTDTEELIFQELRKVAGTEDEDILVVKDRYYREMKPSITEAELRALKAHYKVKRWRAIPNPPNLSH